MRAVTSCTPWVSGLDHKIYPATICVVWFRYKRFATPPSVSEDSITSSANRSSKYDAMSCLRWFCIGRFFLGGRNDVIGGVTVATFERPPLHHRMPAFGKFVGRLRVGTFH